MSSKEKIKALFCKEGICNEDYYFSGTIGAVCLTNFKRVVDVLEMIKKEGADIISVTQGEAFFQKLHYYTVFFQV